MSRQRSAVFAMSDIHCAAEEFVEALSEHAETIWEPQDKLELIAGLTDKAILILRDPGAKW